LDVVRIHPSAFKSLGCSIGGAIWIRGKQRKRTVRLVEADQICGLDTVQINLETRKLLQLPKTPVYASVKRVHHEYRVRLQAASEQVSDNSDIHNLPDNSERFFQLFSTAEYKHIAIIHNVLDIVPDRLRCSLRLI
jgi:hypothetical protein